ncbi:MAG: recombinase family protein [Lachnospiraceae bacterium]|nr:recombinase family protein [Lachnospiraceae bacterium]
MDKRKRVIGYIRVSTTAQDVERQRVQIKEYCTDNGLALIDVFEDEGISGSSNNRPGYIRLLELTKEDADIIVVSELSRLSRNDEIFAVMSDVNRLLNSGLDVIFIDTKEHYYGYKTLELIDIMRIAIAAEYAKAERRKITDRMRSGKVRCFLQSEELMCKGSVVPFGYSRKDNENYVRGKTPKSILVRDENAPIVQEIFQMCIDGKTAKEIQREMISRGIKTVKGNDFFSENIYRILHNPCYKGVWRILPNRDGKNQTAQGKCDSIERKGDALVSEEVWDKAQAILNQNRVVDVPNNGVNYNALRYIIKCPCGKNLYIVRQTSTGLRYYRCAAKKNKYDETICANGGVNADVALKAVWTAVKTAIAKNEFAEMSNERISGIIKEIERLTQRIQSLNADIATAKGEQSAILERLGVLTNPELLMNQQRLYEDKDKFIRETEKEIEQIKTERQAKEATKAELTADVAIETIDALSIEDKARLFKKYLCRVVYYSETQKRGTFVIDFKNGIRKIVCIHTKHRAVDAVELPSTFSFDADSRKILMPILKSDTENQFALPTTENIQLSSEEAMSQLLDNEEYRIEGITNLPYFE